jgi:poly(hydroxyalkanoate) depolymerase family esterase
MVLSGWNSCLKLRIMPLVLLALCGLSAPPALAGQFEQKLLTAKSYPNSRNRQYQVFVPSSYTGQNAVPMVMVLHGCRQTERNMIAETRFADLAERDGFIAVYPFITSFDGLRSPNCWGFFLDQHIHEGAGEVEDLHQIGLAVEATYKIDPNRRYVAGLSSGAGMAVALAVAQSEYFAAAGAVAGLPYAETSSSVGFVCSNPGTFKPIPAVVTAMQAEQRHPQEQRPVPVMTIHSRNDCTVNAVAAENIRDSWLRRYGISRTATTTRDCTAEGVRCTQTTYGSQQRSVVETVFYEGERGNVPLGTGSHYWVGDNQGEFANPRGPSASELLWTFFKGHPFADTEPPSISVTSASASGRSITVSGTASAAAGSTVTEVMVRLDGRFPQAAKAASGTTNWTAIFAAVPDNATYIPVATVRDSDGLTETATGQAVSVGSPPPPEPPEITISEARAAGSCILVTGAASDPEGQIAKVAVELGTRGLKPAALSAQTYSYEECGLPGGSYATRAEATDRDGLTSVASGPTVQVDPTEMVTANWQEHMGAGRIRVYGPPCSSVGFGACDAGFADLFLRHQFNTFPLHRRPPTTEWYEDTSNIP